MPEKDSELRERLSQLVSPGGQHDEEGDIEATMKQVSLLLSLAGLALMVAGLVLMLLEGATFSSTDISALGPLPFGDWKTATPGLAVVSLGIILLSILPIVRVLLALRLYWRGRKLLDAGATLVVLVELLASIIVG
jgi:uncharacterized membrane protein